MHGLSSTCSTTGGCIAGWLGVAQARYTPRAFRQLRAWVVEHLLDDRGPCCRMAWRSAGALHPQDAPAAPCMGCRAPARRRVVSVRFQSCVAGLSLKKLLTVQ